MVQQRKLVEVEAARQAFEQQVEQTKVGYERQVLGDLSDAQKKVDELGQDLVKVEESRASRPCGRRSTERSSSLHCTPLAAASPRRNNWWWCRPIAGSKPSAMISNRGIGL